MNVLIPITLFALIVCINQTSAQCLPYVNWVYGYKDENEAYSNPQFPGYKVKLSDVSQKQFEIVIIKDNKELDKLCSEIFGELKDITAVGVTNTGIREIDNGAFQQVNNLQHIEISENEQLKQINSGVFNNIPSLITLTLASNQIVKIHHDAFDYLVNLREIDLSLNQIRTIKSTWFKGCPKLSTIDLSQNRISVIPNMAFKNIRSMEIVNIDLQENKINRIEPGAFANLQKIGKLQLRRNQIEIVPNMFGNLIEARKIGLNRNKIKCMHDDIIHQLSQFNEVKINRNPIREGCELRRPEFLRRHGEKFHVNMKAEKDEDEEED